MTNRCVKYKYLPIDCEIIKDKALITNITSLYNGKVAVSSSYNHSPITLFNTVVDEETKKIKLGKKVHNIILASKINIKFVGIMKEKVKEENGFVVIPKHKFDLMYLSIDEELKSIIPENKQSLHDYIVDTIINTSLINDSFSSICSHKECYHLIGFVELCGFNLIVQQICSHTQNESHFRNKQLFIFNSTIDIQNMCISNTVLLKSFDLILLFKGIGMKQTEIEKSIVTSVSTNGINELIFLTTSGVHGRLWKVSYFSSLRFFGIPELKINSQLKYSPRGVTYVDNDDLKDKQILIICDSNKKIVYGQL